MNTNNVNNNVAMILIELLEELKNAPKFNLSKYEAALNYAIGYMQFNGMSITTENDNKRCDNHTISDDMKIKPYFNVPASVGNDVEIMGKKYIIAHVEDDVVYLILMYWEKDVKFNKFTNSNDYYNSTIARECLEWYNNLVPLYLKNRGSLVDVTIDGETLPCFIPTENDIMEKWEYFYDKYKNQFKNYNGELRTWWTSTNSDDKKVCCITTDGHLYRYGHQNDRYGFRPALAIKKCEFCG